MKKSVRFLLAFMLVWLTNGHTSAASAPCLQILIPLYIYPNWYAPADYQWPDVVSASSQVPIVAIINPASGPTPTPNSDYVRGMNDLLAADDVKMIGYVRTDYTNQPLATVKAEIDAYANEYDTWITGIFFDEVSNVSADLAYYTEIYDYARAKPTFDLVVVNPGTNTDEVYFSQPAADVGTIFESASASWTGYTAPGYLNQYDRSKFSMMVHGTSAESTMKQHLDLAITRGFGYVYVTDETFAGNPWDNLPTYWDAEVEYIEQLNQTCVPTAVELSKTDAASHLPTALIALGLGALTVAAWRKKETA